jgi:hypothetical protein
MSFSPDWDCLIYVFEAIYFAPNHCSRFAFGKALPEWALHFLI